MGEKLQLDPLYIVRVRCENEHTFVVDENVIDPKTKKPTGKKVATTYVQYLNRLWVIWRPKGSKTFELAQSDDRGYLQPCNDDGEPDMKQSVTLAVDEPYEFFFVRHPEAAIPQLIRDLINDGALDFGKPRLLELKKSPTGLDKEKKPIDEALLLVPEDPEAFWPKGSKLYDRWALYRSMPNALCLPVAKQVRRLQLHLGAMRFLVGDSHNPYRPVEAVLGKFDIMLWNSVMVFQDYLESGSIRILSDEIDVLGESTPRPRLYEKTFPFEPRVPPTGIDPKTKKPFKKPLELELFESTNYVLANTTLQAAPKVVTPPVHRGVVDEKTGDNLAKWLEKDARKPDFIVVCWDPPFPNWIHELVAPKLAEWSADLKNQGFPPPGNDGSRGSGVMISNSYRDIRELIVTGNGAQSTSIHKVGGAADLWMGALIGNTQDNPAMPNYYPLYFTRNFNMGPFEVFGEVTLDDFAKATNKDLFKTQIRSITPLAYDPTSPTGGSFVIKADFTKVRYINISESAKAFGFFNVPPHGKGWKGNPGDTYVLGTNKPFVDLMAQLDEQMFSENFDPTAKFTVNGHIGLVGEDMKREYGALKDWRNAFGVIGTTADKGPTPLITLHEATTDDEKKKLKKDIDSLRGMAATRLYRRWIVNGVLNESIDYKWKPPSFPCTVEPMAFDPATKKSEKYDTFEAPGFKGKPNHLEWWHFQARKVGDKNIGSDTLWIDLVRLIGISRDIVEEIYPPGTTSVTAK